MKKYLLSFAIALLAAGIATPALAGDPGVSACVPGQESEQNGANNSGADSEAIELNNAYLPAKDAGAKPVAAQPPQASVYSPFIDFQTWYDAWLQMVHRTHEEEQPDWMTPIVTVVGTLQQEIRTDFTFNTARNNLHTSTYASKGTEIIPTENTELIFGNPTYVTRDLGGGKQAWGWADWMFLCKYRLLSSPSDAGNYVLTLMLSSTFATGSSSVTANHDVFTPMIGFGKGIKTEYGEFDYQGTIGPSIPDAQTGTLGTPVTWNSTFQYGNRFRFGEWTIPLWPEFETTWISYPNGEHSGQQQIYLTPGLIAGRFKLSEHTYFVLGAGYQLAATQASTYDHQWLVTLRIPYF